MQTQPIGILSGTFDPIHLGHTHLANKMLQLCNLQKILLIPCSQSPLRTQPIAPPTDRLNMVKLAIANQTQLSIDAREINQDGISYTIETLKSLRQKNKTTPLALIMGTDVFNRFIEWHEWQKILELVHLLIAHRPGSWQITNPKAIELLRQWQITTPQELQKKIAGLIYLTNINPLPIAATKIRTLLKNRKDASSLVAPAIWQYLCKKQLYI